MTDARPVTRSEFQVLVERVEALEQRDPAQVGFEAYRRRAREIEDRRDRERREKEAEG